MRKLTLLLLISFAGAILPAAGKPSPAPSSPLERVEAKVTTHVISYFKTHSLVGKPKPGGYTTVTVDITTTEPVEGWTGRYRTEGKATISPALQGESYAQSFEVVAEIDAKNVVRIIDTKLVGPAK
ncbi:MAG: hypothetical protein HY736_08040 [Verrucomicrobia bacterium]|nr:hypothetical protein [Verrucomicrobiota bacterium]